MPAWSVPGIIEHMTFRVTPQLGSDRRSYVLAQAGLSLLAAGVFTVRAFRTGFGDAIDPLQSPVPGVVLAGAAAILSAGAAVVAFRSTRAAAGPVAVALALEIFVLDAFVAPPRLITAIPLLGALAVAVVPRPNLDARASTVRVGGPSGALQVATGLSFLLLAPVGLMYFTTGLVAPMPDLLVVYAVFAGVVALAVRLARMRSWWIVAVPPSAAAWWFAMLWLGESLRGWSG